MGGMNAKTNLDIANEIMQSITNIEYGFPDEDGSNIMTKDFDRWDNDFFEFYYLQTLEELQQSKIGVCWDLVELERKLFEDEGVSVSTYFICSYNDEELPSHTILVFKSNEEYFWFEYSWGQMRGIHKYNDISSLLEDVVDKFVSFHGITEEGITKVVKYDAPPSHIGCLGFYSYCKEQKTILKK